MQANGCATFVPYQKVVKDATSEDWDGCNVSTVWDVKLKAFMIYSFLLLLLFFLQPALQQPQFQINKSESFFTYSQLKTAQRQYV